MLKVTLCCAQIARRSGTSLIAKAKSSCVLCALRKRSLVIVEAQSQLKTHAVVTLYKDQRATKVVGDPCCFTLDVDKSPLSRPWKFQV
jgi:hypothetical protein